MVPSLHAGAADAGAVSSCAFSRRAAIAPIVVSSGGRLEAEVTAAGAKFIAMNVASNNPVVMLRNALALTRIVREERCDIIHAHGRAPAWSAYYRRARARACRS